MLQQRRHSYPRFFNTCSVSNTSVSRLQKYHTDSFLMSVFGSYDTEASVNAAALNPQLFSPKTNQSKSTFDLICDLNPFSLQASD